MSIGETLKFPFRKNLSFEITVLAVKKRKAFLTIDWDRHNPEEEERLKEEDLYRM
jgi:hypothetical protein